MCAIWSVEVDVMPDQRLGEPVNAILAFKVVDVPDTHITLVYAGHVLPATFAPALLCWPPGPVRALFPQCSVSDFAVNVEGLPHRV